MSRHTLLTSALWLALAASAHAEVASDAGANANANELQRVQGRYALVTMCIGGGQGLAALFERV